MCNLYSAQYMATLYSGNRTPYVPRSKSFGLFIALFMVLFCSIAVSATPRFGSRFGSFSRNMFMGPVNTTNNYLTYNTITQNFTTNIGAGASINNASIGTASNSFMTRMR